MAYKVKKPKKKYDGVVRKTKIRTFGVDNKFHNLWYDGYGRFFYYINKGKTRVWLKK